MTLVRISHPHMINKLALQEDLAKISNWENTWLIKFSVNKYVVLHCSRLLSEPQLAYLLENHLLQSVTEHRVMLGSNISFFLHIKYTSAKATRTLNFIRRNLNVLSPQKLKHIHSFMVNSSCLRLLLSSVGSASG